MKKVLITGCGGMLGEAVYNVFSKKYDVTATDIHVYKSGNGLYLEYLNVSSICDSWAKTKQIKPDLIINLAAKTDLEWCEKHKDMTMITNYLGAGNMALIAKVLKIPYVYVSTAGIFDGKKAVYTEADTPVPISMYGKAKYMGELATKSIMKNHLILRAGWMMGGGVVKDKKFVNKIYQQLKEGNNVIHAVVDKLGSPTYTYDFAKNMALLVEKKVYGTYHLTCEGEASRYDVAKEFVRLMGLSGEVDVIPKDSSYFHEEYFANRPASEGLINHKLSQRGLNKMRNWRACLKEYSEVFKKDLKGGV